MKSLGDDQECSAGFLSEARDRKKIEFRFPCREIGIAKQPHLRGSRHKEGKPSSDAPAGVYSERRGGPSPSMSRSAQTGEGSCNTDWVDLHPDPGRSASLSPQSGCRMFSRV